MKWVVFAIIIFTLAEVTTRYVFNKPTIQLPVIVTMSGAALIILSSGYVHLHRGHVRVDIFYSRLSQRRKAILDIILTLLFFFPAVGLLTHAAGEWMWYAWASGERSRQTFWYPLMGPVRTVVFVGLALFMLQGAAQFVRDLHLAIRNKSYD